MNHDQPSLGMVRRFLRSNGWIRRRVESPDLELHTKATEEFGDVEIVLPSRYGAPRSDLQIDHALRILAELSEVDKSVIRSRVNSIDYDALSAILPDSSVYKQSIPLNVANACMRSTRDIIANAALCEYESLSITSFAQAARSYADDCRFTHTFRGSFGFKVLSHLGPHEEFELSPRESPPPPERGIIRRLCTSIDRTVSAVGAGNPQELIALSHLHLGLDSDGYSALARMIERSNAEKVTFSFDFSLLWRLPEGEAQNSSFTLGRDSTLLIREAAAAMRVRPPEAVLKVRGRVVNLHSENAPADLFRPGGREIEIKWDSEDFGEPVVRVRLSPEEYLLAWEAHGRGRDVEVVGTLEMTGTGAFRISEPTSFKVL